MSFGLGSLGALSALGGSTGGSVLGPAAATMAAFQGLLNAGLEYRNQQYQKSIQRQIFEREDNSIQRRVADLQAAGLSPVLAAGQGAGTGGVVSTAAPQLQGMSDLATQAMALMTQEANISKTEAEKSLMKVQEEKLIADTQATNVRRRMDQHDLNLSELTGTRTTPSSIGRMWQDLAGSLFYWFCRCAAKTNVKGGAGSKSKTVFRFNSQCWPFNGWSKIMV